MTPILLVCFLVFLTIVLFAIALGWAALRAQDRKKVRVFLTQLDDVRPQTGKASVAVAEDRAGTWRDSAWVASLELWIRQSGEAVPVTDLLARSGVFAIGGIVAGFLVRAFVPAPIGSLVLGVLGGAMPWLRLRSARTKRLQAFEAQFPDALDFLARSMLAGHGFAMGLRLLTQESPDPLAKVFQQVSNELQLGAPLERALGKLSEQIPLVDVRFFVSAVLLQQASGGNLAGILNGLAFVVRERFRLSGDVRSASAHGRITSLVLLLLPIVLTISLMVTDPGYLSDFYREPEGKFLLIAAVCGQVIGHMVIQRIVNIRV